MEERLEKIKAREQEVFTALWKKLGEEGLKELSEALIPLSTYTPGEGYMSSYADNFEPSGMDDMAVSKEFYARRKTIERVSGVLKRIYQIGFPVVEEKKTKKAKPSFK